MKAETLPSPTDHLASAESFYASRRVCIERLQHRFLGGEAEAQALAVGIIQCLLHKPPMAWVEAGCLREQKGMPLVKASGQWFGFAALMLTAGCLFQFLVIRRTRAKTSIPPDQNRRMIVSVGLVHNGNKHLLRHLESTGEQAEITFVDVDTGFFKSAGSEIPPALYRRLKVVRPFALSFLWTGLTHSFRYLRPLADLAAEVSAWDGCPPLRGRFFRLARNLVRGECLAAFFQKMNPLPEKVLFGNLNADCVAADAFLRSRGVETIHWLHGTVEDEYKYFGFSSACLAPTGADAEVRREFGSYQICRSEAPPVDLGSMGDVPPEAKDGGTVLLTNLLHTGHQLPESVRKRSLALLLELLGTSGFPEVGGIHWFPHPMECASPDFTEFSALAEKHGIQVGAAGGWKGTLARASTVVTTFSGSVVDVLRSGQIPVIWSEVRYPNVGLWKHLPGDLLFKDAGGLRIALDARSRWSGRQLLESLLYSEAGNSVSDPWKVSIV